MTDGPDDPDDPTDHPRPAARGSAPGLAMSRVLRIVRLLWVVPLSLGSFAFHRVMRAVFRSLAARAMHRDVQRGNRWQLLSRALLERRGTLPVIMLTAPRWNTHAIIGNAGPLEVKGSLSIDLAAAARSARSWSVVVYRFPRSITVASVGSIDPPSEEPWWTIALEPGTYSLGVRYYLTTDTIELPAVRVDGVDHLPARGVGADALAVYDAVRGRRGLFYLCAHYYVFNVLDYRAWLPAAFVQREFLPVGNPQTRFRYGAVRAGQAIALRFSPALLSGHDVFFTLYNRYSFPVTWCVLTAAQHDTGPVAAAGFYLVRIHRRSKQTDPFDDGWVEVTTS
jgi:hypothetical protein